MKSASILLFIILILFGGPLMAGEADVVKVVIEKFQDGTYSFHVTVAHRDESWQHYANRWEIVGMDGTVLGRRVLHHPHIEEQPFTRSLENVVISEDEFEVIIRAHDSVHGYGGITKTVDLP